MMKAFEVSISGVDGNSGRTYRVKIPGVKQVATFHSMPGDLCLYQSAGWQDDGEKAWKSARDAAAGCCGRLASGMYGIIYVT